MKQLFFSVLTLFVCTSVLAQNKKPLSHSDYDQWQSIAQPQISNNGAWVVYQINPQEGDGELIIQSFDGKYKKSVARGYGSAISPDSRYVVFKIKPFFKDTREAKIKKKRPDEMPKDTLALVELGKDSVQKIVKVKSFKFPEKAGSWLAYHLEKAEAAKPAVAKADTAISVAKLFSLADSLKQVADSLKRVAKMARKESKAFVALPKKVVKPSAPAKPEEPFEEGTELVLKNLADTQVRKFQNVSDYYFSEKGNVLIVETTKKKGDTILKPMVLWVNTNTLKTDTVMQGFQDAKNFALDTDGEKLAFVAERDSVAKALKKYYKLWYYQPGYDSARLIAAKGTPGMLRNFIVSPDFTNMFSKNGKQLYFGMAPDRRAKDTTLADFEIAKLDVWGYNDDELQPQQLVRSASELKRSYMAVVDKDFRITALADTTLENTELAEEGNAPFALGETTLGYRIQNQWEWSGNQDLYVVNVATGERKLVAKKVRGGGSISPGGKFIFWYDWNNKNYFAYEIANGKTVNLTKDIKMPLYDEEDDHPDAPPAHGRMGWLQNDEAFFVYDKYDIWKLDPTGAKVPENFTKGQGRKNKWTFRYSKLDFENDYIKPNEPILLSVTDEKEKGKGYVFLPSIQSFSIRTDVPVTYPLWVVSAQKAKENNNVVFVKMSPDKSPDLYTTTLPDIQNLNAATQLSNTNPQQKNYNWYTVELHQFKAVDGKPSEGLLFKPENFDSTKKYPVVFYFYERDADTRYMYRTPAPSASTINIAWFTSNGYIVFDPDIRYKNGYPGQSAYNYVMGAANYLSKMKFVDSTKMGIQGQSWGGYQVAYLVTRTGKFAAAGAGAPVSNMFSAYGGIRWGSGMSRQAQYEKNQSRIGYTPWQRPDLYVENSPLFKADKVTTPLLIMHNDKDDAVPWYQGIELFTALRRNGKKAWLLQYNDEAHNLMERRNRKDLSVRLGQFFGHYLKGEPMPRWMQTGVPAVEKGVEWGL